MWFNLGWALVLGVGEELDEWCLERGEWGAALSDLVDGKQPNNPSVSVNTIALQGA